MDIPLMWCQEANSLHRLTVQHCKGTGMKLAFSTVLCQLWLAASHFLTCDLMVAHPQVAFMDQQQHVLQQPCWATGGRSYMLHSSGMCAQN
jgi:hypothetical protein